MVKEGKARDENRPDLRSAPDPSADPASDETLFDLLTGMLTLIQQTLSDHVALARIELRLTLKSVVLISLMLSCMALLGVLMGITLLFEIGRASCREIGEIWGVNVVVEGQEDV